MKNILLALAFLFLLSECNQFKPPLPQFILSGKIENLDAASVKFIHSLDEIIIKLNADGTFTDTIYDFVDGYYNFKAGEEYTKIYLKDGYNLFITLNVVDFDESIKFNGIGSPENNYLAQKYLNTENSKYHEMQDLNIKHKRSIEEDVIDNMLPRVSNENVLSSDFKPTQGNLHDAEKL